MLGAAMIRANVLNRRATWLFTIGLPLGLTIDMATGAFFEENGDTPEVGFFVGLPLFCSASRTSWCATEAFCLASSDGSMF